MALSVSSLNVNEICGGAQFSLLCEASVVLNRRTASKKKKEEEEESENRTSEIFSDVPLAGTRSGVKNLKRAHRIYIVGCLVIFGAASPPTLDHVPSLDLTSQIGWRTLGYVVRGLSSSLTVLAFRFDPVFLPPFPDI